jgi:hypothetical protein
VKNMSEKDVIKEYIEGKTLDNISFQMGFSRKKITNILKRNHIKRRRRGRKNGSTFAFVVQKEIFNKYLKGETTTFLSKQYDCSKDKILCVLKNNNIKTRTRSEQKRKYKLDEDSFKNLNENSLYWLGFIAADGNLYINPRGNKVVQFGLHQKDEEHLNKLKIFLKTNKPIYYYESKRKYKDNYITTPEVKFNINSSIIFEDICRYGIMPKKTFKLEINDILINRDFFRGLFDGDGSIFSNNKGKDLVICLNGIEQVLKVFCDFIKKEINLDLNIFPSKSICRTRAYGKKALDILDLLYGDSSIYLDRKMELYKFWKSKKKN